MSIPIIVLIFQGIPEQIAVALLAFTIAGISFKWLEAIFLGTTLAIVAYLIRLLPVTFGVHTVILICFLFFYLSLIKKIDLSRAILSTLLSFLLLLFCESLIVPIIMHFLDISRTDLLINNKLRILVTLPHVFILYFLVFLINKIGFK